MTLITRTLVTVSIAGIVAFASCKNPDKPTDTPTSGKVRVVIDGSFSKLFRAQEQAFEAIYPNADIHISSFSEYEALDMLKKDSCKVVVLTRNLLPGERKSFEAENIFPVSTMIAEDAIALIVHPENPDSVFSATVIKAVLAGEITQWDSVSPDNESGDIRIVFDHEASGNARYMKDSLLGGSEFGKNVFALNSNPEVIEYVGRNKNALGFISVNWISDPDDETTGRFLQNVKLASVSDFPGSPSYKPYQAYIKTGEYPFVREVFMINRQTRAGLGMGFVHFVAGEKGQLIILKSGLVPSIAPVRVVNIKQ